MTRAVRVPGDKSIAHRALLLASLAEGRSRLRGLPPSRDVAATAGALRALGVRVEEGGDLAAVHGPAAFRAPPAPLDCMNSGTTARLLTGLLVGAGVEAVLDGDASLRGRPMDRVVYPLQAMGGKVRYLESPDRLPIRVEARASGGLRPLRHRPRVASAQVKSALLLAGLASGTRVEVVEPGRSRDHTERMLSAMGAPIAFGPEGEGARARLDPADAPGLRPLDLRLPGDPSSAAFLLAAALLAGRPLRVEGMSLNPTRTAYLDVLEEMGVSVRRIPAGEEAGEPVGDVEARPAPLRAWSIDGGRVPRLLDEVPALAVLAVRAEGTSRLRGAAELRLKESDRLTRLRQGLEALGARCVERPDGLEIEGTPGRLAGRVATGGDHRIAMAFAALGAAPDVEATLDDPECVAVSFPDFWDRLDDAVGR